MELAHGHPNLFVIDVSGNDVLSLLISYAD